MRSMLRMLRIINTLNNNNNNNNNNTCRWARRLPHLAFVSRSVNQNTNNPPAVQTTNRNPTGWQLNGLTVTPLAQSSRGRTNTLAPARPRKSGSPVYSPSAPRFQPCGSPMTPRSQHDVPERLFLINFNPKLTPLPIETKSTRHVDVLYPISTYLPFTIIRACTKRRSLYHRLKQNGIIIKFPAIHIILL